MSYDSRYSGIAYADFEHLHDLDRQGPAPTTITVEYERFPKRSGRRLGEHVADKIVEVAKDSGDESERLA